MTSRRLNRKTGVDSHPRIRFPPQFLSRDRSIDLPISEGRGGDLELLGTRRGERNRRDKFRWSIEEIEVALNEAMLERTRHGEGISSGRKMRSLAGLIVSKPVAV